MQKHTAALFFGVDCCEVLLGVVRGNIYGFTLRGRKTVNQTFGRMESLFGKLYHFIVPPRYGIGEQ